MQIPTSDLWNINKISLLLTKRGLLIGKGEYIREALSQVGQTKVKVHV